MTMQEEQNKQYDHYVAVDWAKSNMAIARISAKAEMPKIIDVKADIEELKKYLGELKGKKILTIEETTTTQWLYTELIDSVDKLIVCDPYRNRLLSEGAKTDKIDAGKLSKLLRAGLLKEVYHTSNEFVYLRKLVSGYGDLVKAGVRLKNQRSSLFRAVGLNAKARDVKLDHVTEQFVLNNLDEQIKAYEVVKKRYEKEIEQLGKKSKEISNQESLAGIGWINAIKIVARVISPRRFKNKGDYLCYCGLVKLEKMSGGRSYGKKNARYSREMKSIYKTAAIAAIGRENDFNGYYNYLIKEKRYPEYKARHAVARRIAIISLGIFKNGRPYKAKAVN